MSKNKEYTSLEEKLYPKENMDSIITNNNIRIRYEQSVKWYIKKANYNRKMFYFFSVLEIIFPGIIIIINSASEYYNFSSNLIINIFSVLSTIVASILALFKFHKKWMHYRFIAEYLQSEFSLYIECVGKYNTDDVNKNKEFITNIETIMKNELNDWTKLVRKSGNGESLK